VRVCANVTTAITLDLNLQISLLRRVSDLRSGASAPRTYEFSIALVVVKVSRESINCTESSKSRK